MVSTESLLINPAASSAVMPGGGRMHASAVAHGAADSFADMMTKALAARQDHAAAASRPSHPQDAPMQGSANRAPAPTVSALDTGRATLSGTGAAAGSGGLVYRGLSGTHTAEQMLRRSAEELVSTAFLKPMFAMLRNEPLKSGLFGQSQAEKSFGPLLDGEFARNIVSSAQWPIVDAVVRRLQGVSSGVAASSMDAARDPEPTLTKANHAV